MPTRRIIPSVLAFGALAVLVTLLALLLPELSPDPSQLPHLTPRSDAEWDQLPVRQAAELVLPETWRTLAKSAGTNSVFTPILPLVPQQPPPAPPPATLKMELVYQGHLMTSSGRRQAFVLRGDTVLVVTNGSVVVADFLVRSIERDALTLGNPAGTNHVLPFNKKTVVEVPAR